jgi:hypothetical protein
MGNGPGRGDSDRDRIIDEVIELLARALVESQRRLSDLRDAGDRAPVAPGVPADDPIDQLGRRTRHFPRSSTGEDRRASSAFRRASAAARTCSGQ